VNDGEAKIEGVRDRLTKGNQQCRSALGDAARGEEG
jgi:hypothetical protein